MSTSERRTLFPVAVRIIGTPPRTHHARLSGPLHELPLGSLEALLAFEGMPDLHPRVPMNR